MRPNTGRTGRTGQAAAAEDLLLEVGGLAVEYPKETMFSHPVRAVEDVSFVIRPGETLALVGESGSGKSTIGKSLLGLAPVTAGKVVFAGQEISHASSKERRRLARDLQVIFQDPYGSLNPSLTVGSILTEPLRVQRAVSKGESERMVSHLLRRVGMPPDAADRYPGNFSGGQRQRIAIARALAVEPRLVVCDEPTSALDVSTQAGVLALLKELQVGLGIAYLFITHDLAIVRRFADRVIVLNHGRIVESGPVGQVCDSPQDPYTQKLVAAAPVPDPVLQRKRRARRATSLTTT